MVLTIYNSFIEIFIQHILSLHFCTVHILLVIIYQHHYPLQNHYSHCTLLELWLPYVLNPSLFLFREHTCTLRGYSLTYHRHSWKIFQIPHRGEVFSNKRLSGVIIGPIFATFKAIASESTQREATSLAAIASNLHPNKVLPAHHQQNKSPICSSPHIIVAYISTVSRIWSYSRTRKSHISVKHSSKRGKGYMFPIMFNESVITNTP